VVEFPPTVLQLTIGRGNDCRCRVESPEVSRLHAALVRRANRGVYLVDLTSQGGTFLNGERVKEEILLMDGDRISLGDRIEFEFQDGVRPAESRVRRWARKFWFSAPGLRALNHRFTRLP
jgi:pSer/pThr/pTyr-binding forkhead associated (FHA) protein